MNKDYTVHWLLGILCSIIWFWGDRAGIPVAAVTLAASVVPGILAHALAYVPDAAPEAPAVDAPNVAPAATPATPAK
jgi:hypothetical protein